MLTMIYSLGHVANPEQSLVELTMTQPYCVTFDFEHTQSYLPGNPVISLTALVLVTKGDTQCSVVPRTEVPSDDGNPDTAFSNTLRLWHSPSVSLTQPWLLETVRIPKPWGAEIWYTGIEQRGVCTVAGIPLPWLLSIAPGRVLGDQNANEPLLLKILDPLPDPGYGDLYFELHREKREVYVVTHLDGVAWPDGIGQIRYGFNQGKVSQFTDIDSFKSAYLRSAETYQSTRNEIDSLLDEHKLELGLVTSDPVSPDLMMQWQAALPGELTQCEEEHKQDMYSYTQLRDLKVGDVIRVDPHQPHSLQHGVRVIEFQTPHYERMILSFTQKVLTQNQWDTESALVDAITDIKEETPLDVIDNSDEYKVESVAAFPEFSVYRITVRAHTTYQRWIERYCLVIGVTGNAKISGKTIKPEQGYLLPASASSLDLTTTDNEAVILIAEPASI